jgi:hypothetical protein
MLFLCRTAFEPNTTAWKNVFLLQFHPQIKLVESTKAGRRSRFPGGATAEPSRAEKRIHGIKKRHSEFTTKRLLLWRFPVNRCGADSFHFPAGCSTERRSETCFSPPPPIWCHYPFFLNFSLFYCGKQYCIVAKDFRSSMTLDLIASDFSFSANTRTTRSAIASISASFIPKRVTSIVPIRKPLG